MTMTRGPTMTKNQAATITGGLSRPGKMPCKGYSLPAARCLTGSTLRSIPGAGILRAFLTVYKTFPPNLCIRLSAYHIDKPADHKTAKRLGIQVSEVSTTNPTCPAPTQGNSCGDCRKCWDKTVPCVAYKRHRGKDHDT